MPTLDDLRAAFGELENRAPASLPQPVPRGHRRRWTALAVAAACTAALAVSVPLLVPDGADRPAGGGTNDVSGWWSFAPPSPFPGALPAPGDGQSPDLAFGFAVPDTIAGYTVIPDLITRTYQHASVYGPTEPPGGQIFVFYRGAFDPSSMTDRTPAEVGDRPAYYGDVSLPGIDAEVAALAWEYADGGWAVVRLGVDARTPVGRQDDERSRARAAADAAEQSAQAVRNELELALAVMPAHDPLRSPVGIPDESHVHVDRLSSSGRAGDLALDGPGGRWWLSWGPDELRASDEPDTSTIDVSGSSWIVYRSDGVPTSLGLVADGWGLTVTPGGGTSLEVMKQFVAALVIAPDPGNRDTWFDAGANLP